MIKLKILIKYRLTMILAIAAAAGCLHNSEFTVQASETMKTSEASETVKETSKENIRWSIDKKGTLYISGDGEMTGEYNFSEHAGEIVRIEMSGDIKKIPAGVFCNLSNLKEAVLPDKLVEIDCGAFERCSSLEKINIPDTVKTIGHYAFRGCSSLKNISLPEGMISIGSNAFSGCNSLETIKIPKGVTEIEWGTFQGCKKLGQVVLNEDVFLIDSYAFSGCERLLNIEIPKTVISIAEDAFYGTELLVISCDKYSVAHQYAKENQISCQLLDVPVTEIFSDVLKGKWYVDDVQYLYDRRIVLGAGNQFTPNGPITKAALITALYRLEGLPEITDDTACEKLKDVSANTWYTDAVCWAYHEKITVEDTDTNTLGVNTPLTREQMAVFLYRYARYKGLDITQSGDLSGLLEADQVRAYGKDEVKWAVGAGLMEGLQSKDKTGAVVYNLAPGAYATKAQMAAILMKFCEKYHL